MDAGFKDGRQFGRAESGGQWRDDFRMGNDPQRGGEGGNLLRSVVGTDKAIYMGSMVHSHGKREAGAGGGPPGSAEQKGSGKEGGSSAASSRAVGSSARVEKRAGDGQERAGMAKKVKR